MNKVLLIFISLLAISCKNPQKNNEVEIKLTGVSDKKDVLEKQKDKCTLLVNNFPSNFKEFNRVYGYDDDTGEGDLYNQYEEDITDFFSCDKISNYTKLEKAISIGINGKWDADAIGLFQFKLLNFIKSNPNEALKILEKIPEKDASSFWYFLFDGPHPEDKENLRNVNMLTKLFGKDNLQSSLLMKEYENLLGHSSE